MQETLSDGDLGATSRKSILKGSSKPEDEADKENVGDINNVNFNEDVTSEPEEKPETVKLPESKAIIHDPYDENIGSCLTFTYKQGLVAKILPNGDIVQSLI